MTAGRRNGRRKRTLGLGVAVLALVALASGLLSAAPASAADECEYSGTGTAVLPASAFNATTVVLGVAAVDVTGVLSVPPECEDVLAGWQVDLGQELVFTSEKPTVRLDPKLLVPGPSGATLTVGWNGNDTDDVTQFTANLLKRTTFGGTFNAIGEPLVANDPLLLKGTLGVADWKTGRYLPYKNRSVRVQWKPVGGTYTSYQPEKTDSKGRIRAVWTNDESGTWRLHYAGNPVAAGATSNTDYVRVVAG